MIDYIHIGGENRPVKFGMNALRLFCKATGMKIADLAKLGDDMSLDDAIQLAFCGLRDGARKEGVKFTCTVDDVADWMDQTGKFEEIFDLYVSQFVNENPTQPEEAPASN